MKYPVINIKLWTLFATLLLFYNAVFSQCPTSATTTTTESRCRENGTIKVNAVPAAAYTYEIVAGPSLIAPTTSSLFTGLEAGTYSIEITGGSCSILITATIPGNYQDPGLLTVDSTNPVICPGGTGCITVKQPTMGRTPYRYEVIAGPVIKPIQTSPKFCGLPEGTYTIQSYDSCGVVRTSTFDVAVDTGDFYGWAVTWDYRFANCNDFIVPVDYGYTNTNSHSLLKVWYVTPGGDTLKVSDFHPTSNYGSSRRDTLSGYSRTYGTWQLLVYDECGRVKKSNFDFYNPTSPYIYTARSTCDGFVENILNSWRFDETVHYIVRRCSDSSIIFNETQVPPNTQWWSGDINLQYDSCYFIETFNGCGDTLRSRFEPGSRPAFNFDGCASPSCNKNGYSLMYLDYPAGGSLPYTYTIISGPSQVGDSMVATSPWESRITWDSLTPGNYRVMVRDACGRKDTIDIDANKSLQRIIDVIQTPHCSGGANLNVKITSNFMPCVYYYWGSTDYLVTKVNSTYPVNYPVINVVTTPVSPTVSGTWQGDFINVNEDSLFLRTYSEGGCIYDTLIRIKKYVAPTLHDVKGYVCGTTGTATMNYKVQGGLAPFRFRIKPDNSSVWGSWQDSSIFTGLTAGTYDVNIEDGCPNGSIRSASFYTWEKSDINFGAPCATVGNSYTFSADPPVNYVNYVWYKDGVLLGSGNSYSIPNYNSAANQGNYQLRQIFRGGTCIDTASKWLVTCSILPLMLDELSGTLKDKKVALQWKTFRDNVGQEMIIERSSDARNFRDIGKVISKANASGSQYFFEDANPGIDNFYKIRVVKENGKISNSNVARVSQNALEDNPVSIRPVPFKSWFTINVHSKNEEPCSIRIFDMSGKTVYKKSTDVKKGNNTIWMDGDGISSLKAGSYIVEAGTASFVKRIKVIKQ